MPRSPRLNEFCCFMELSFLLALPNWTLCILPCLDGVTFKFRELPLSILVLFLRVGDWPYQLSSSTLFLLEALFLSELGLFLLWIVPPGEVSSYSSYSWVPYFANLIFLVVGDFSALDDRPCEKKPVEPHSLTLSPYSACSSSRASCPPNSINLLIRASFWPWSFLIFEIYYLKLSSCYFACYVADMRSLANYSSFFCWSIVCCYKIANMRFRSYSSCLRSASNSSEDSSWFVSFATSAFCWPSSYFASICYLTASFLALTA